MKNELKRQTQQTNTPWLVTLGLFVGVTALAGCGGKATKLIPVEGKVTVGDKVLTGGSVSFHPDKSKGNTTKTAPIGTIGQNGTYKLTTDGKEGAPLGAYKVTVTTMIPPGSDAKPNAHPTTTQQVNQKYIASTTTDLNVEVVENPSTGAYDLKLSK